MNQFLNKTIVTAIIVSLCGCAGTKIHFPSVQPETLDLTKGRQITTASSGFQLLLLIPIGINGRQAKAYSKLQAAAGQDQIADVKIEESWTWALVGTVYKTKLTAMAYPALGSASTNSIASAAAANADKLRELKKLHDDGVLTDEEYESKRQKIVNEL